MTVQTDWLHVTLIKTLLGSFYLTANQTSDKFRRTTHECLWRTSLN